MRASPAYNFDSLPSQNPYTGTSLFSTHAKSATIVSIVLLQDHPLDTDQLLTGQIYTYYTRPFADSNPDAGSDSASDHAFRGRWVDCIDLGIPRGYRTMLISHPEIEGASATKMTLPASTNKSHLPQRLYHIPVEHQSTGLQAFSDRLNSTIESVGVDAASSFPIMRLYSMEGEGSSSSMFKGA